MTAEELAAVEREKMKEEGRKLKEKARLTRMHQLTGRKACVVVRGEKRGGEAPLHPSTAQKKMALRPACVPP